MKSFIHSLSKLVWIKRGFFIRTSFDRLWMKIFQFLFLILIQFKQDFKWCIIIYFSILSGRWSKNTKRFSENQVYGITCPGVYPFFWIFDKIFSLWMMFFPKFTREKMASRTPLQFLDAYGVSKFQNGFLRPFSPLWTWGKTSFTVRKFCLTPKKGKWIEQIAIDFFFWFTAPYPI